MKEALCRKTAGKGETYLFFCGRKERPTLFPFYFWYLPSGPANDLSKSANKVHLKYPSPAAAAPAVADLFPFLNNYFFSPFASLFADYNLLSVCGQLGLKPRLSLWQSWCGHSSTLNATTLCRSATSARRREGWPACVRKCTRESHTPWINNTSNF